VSKRHVLFVEFEEPAESAAEKCWCTWPLRKRVEFEATSAANSKRPNSVPHVHPPRRLGSGGQRN